MPTSTAFFILRLLSILSLCLGLLSCLYIAFDQRRRPAPHMAVMKWVWPINALWAGPLGVWAYRALGNGGLAPLPAGDRRHPSPDHAVMSMDMPMEEHANIPADTSMNMPPAPQKPFPERVATGTLHCGAGCTLADLVGPWLFRLMPFTLAGSALIGEWGLDYVLALAFGVIFQYAGLAAMTRERGGALWWRAFKVDFLSLTAWQAGMYGWMAVAMFAFGLPMTPDGAVFWFMMQISMLCGFFTAYPMNWWLIRRGIKTAM